MCDVLHSICAMNSHSLSYIKVIYVHTVLRIVSTPHSSSSSPACPCLFERRRCGFAGGYGVVMSLLSAQAMERVESIQARIDLVYLATAPLVTASTVYVPQPATNTSFSASANPQTSYSLPLVPGIISFSISLHRYHCQYDQRTHTAPTSAFFQYQVSSDLLISKSTSPENKLESLVNGLSTFHYKKINLVGIGFRA